jgi:amino acid adenylation domain-containing protein
MDNDKTSDFWRCQFSGIEAVPFPQLPHHGYQPKADSVLRRTIDHLHLISGNRDVTASTIIRAAWSILAAQHTGSDDVLFGALVTGRQAPIEGIERKIAPLIAALPIRITLEPGERVDAFLKRVHQQSVDMIGYEQTEFLDIRRINADTERATRFNTLLVVQPPAAVQSGFYTDDSESPFESYTELKSTINGLGNFNPHALLVTCQLSHTNSLGLELSFDSNVVDTVQIERLAAQFEHVLRQICKFGDTKLEEIDMTSAQDLAELWKWNAQVPDAVQTCVQDRIAKAVNLRPEAPAICAWDGNLSYKRIHELSDRLMSQLIALGAGNGMIIALCFEKSMWQPVAALGAIKAGAACVALDVQQPEERLRAITNQVGPKLVLSSASKEGLAGRISDGAVIVVDSIRFSEPYTIPMMNNHVSQRKICPSDILYVLFTSGSTGVPKGVVMTNEAFSSAVTYQAEELLVGEESRVFDFVSYSFDITWSNLLNTLIRGGCLCIPSEWERMNDFAGAFNRLQANYVHFPPSVASSLAPSALPGLKTLVMGGEPILNLEVSRWTQAENILGIYGPAECAQGAVSIDPVDANSPNNHVGHPFGARFWLIQPGHPDRLAAIGAVGELLIEGPTLAREYLGDPEKTAAAFIEAPKWLRRGAPGHRGRTSRLYRTGDLLRYNSDGTFTFIGRKDGMVKLRGQRIELSEIECHIRSNLHDPNLCDAIAAEMITPRDTESPIIAVFVSLAEMKEALDTSKQDMQAKLRLALKGVEKRLSECLPRYMLPGAYFPLAKMPVTGTNKINRRLLREMGNVQTTKMLAQMQLNDQEDTFRAPETVMEQRLQALWSSILRIESSSISAESNFFRIGGDSIAAMRLVAAARQQHISLTVADVLLKPSLCQLAQVVTYTPVGEESLQLQPPFSLLPPEIDRSSFVRSSILPLLHSKVKSVKDVFPTTAFQTQAISDALQDPPSEWHHWILDLPLDVDFLKLKQACERLVDDFDILHTVFIHTDSRFLQVQLENFKPEFDQVECKDEDSVSFVDALCEQDLKRKRLLGSSFVRFIAVKHSSERHRLILRISHAQFDGYSLGPLLERLSGIYSGKNLSKPPSFAQFMAFTKQRERTNVAYWTRRLEGSIYPHWSTSNPTPPVRAYGVEDRLIIEETIAMPATHNTDGYSLATIFHAACCIILSRHFRQGEIIIGRLVTGRSMLPSSLQNIMGPCFSEIPIRMSIRPTDTLLQVAKELHHQFIEDSSHEGLGMDEIIQQCTDWPTSGAVRDFGWRTAFQQRDDLDHFEFLGNPSRVTAYERKQLPRTRPEIYATPKKETLVLSFEGNQRLISKEAGSAILLGLRDIFADFSRDNH